MENKESYSKSEVISLMAATAYHVRTNGYGMWSTSGSLATCLFDRWTEKEFPDPKSSPAIDIPLSAKTKEEIIKRGPWYLVQIGEGMEQVGREAMLRENVLDAMEEYAQRQRAPAIEGKEEDNGWDSVKLIGRSRLRHQELAGKRYEWRAFYTGWMEGRVDVLQALGIFSQSPTPPAGAEGEDEIPEDELDADRLLGKLEASRKYNAALMKQLSAAQAKIAELEQTIREQKEWINSH